jgi:hypothetical protein
MGPKAELNSLGGNKNLLPLPGIENRKLYKYSQDSVRSNALIKKSWCVRIHFIKRTYIFKVSLVHLHNFIVRITSKIRGILYNLLA